MSPTLLKSKNLRFVIYPKDHMPKHIHIKGPDCEAKFDLEKMNYIHSFGFSLKSLNEIKKFITDRKDYFLEQWNEWG